MERTAHLFPYWMLCAGLVLASTYLTFDKIGKLPVLDLEFNELLSVRGTGSQPHIESDQSASSSLKVADKLVSISGHRVKTLGGVASILREGKVSGEIPIQFVRPNHRFTVDARGTEAAKLPGVIPSDLLWEVDGRRFLEPISYEGVGSILAHRPQALLGFERTNALFKSKIIARYSFRRFSFLFAFLFSAIALIVLRFRRHARIPPYFALYTAFGGVALVWAFVLGLHYSWVSADPLLSMGVLVGIIFSRPLAIFGWSAIQDSVRRNYIILIVGALIVILLGGANYGSLLSREALLQIAGGITLTFVFYESLLIFLAPTRSTFGDRGIFIVGILSIITVSAIAAYFSNSDLFLSRWWPWFVGTMLALLWFQDFVFALRGPETTGIAAISSIDERHHRVAEYLDVLGTVFEREALQICVVMGDETTVFTRKRGVIQVKRASDELHDAMCILTEEQVEIPMVVGSNNLLMEGIANAMNFMVAAEISAPCSSLVVDNMRVVFVALRDKRSESPSYASTESLDFVRANMRPLVWSSLIVAALTNRGTKADEFLNDLQTKVKRLEAKNQKLQAEIENSFERSDLLQRDQVELGSLVQFFSEQPQQEVIHALEKINELLEPGLIESISYLLEPDEPMVISGARGSGKTFTGIFSYHLDSRYTGVLVVLDAANLVANSGWVNSIPNFAIDAAKGGGLLIKSSILLSDTVLEKLINSSSQSFRLILCYRDRNAETTTVLAKLPEFLQERLEERELVLPSFASRTSIKRNVLQHLLESASRRTHKQVLGFSRDAWVTLEGLKFEGNVAEARDLLNAALDRTETEVLEDVDLKGSF